jgi:hypothetical protein
MTIIRHLHFEIYIFRVFLCLVFVLTMLSCLKCKLIIVRNAVARRSTGRLCSCSDRLGGLFW